VKKSFKAYSALFCALVGALTFAACGGDDNGTDADSGIDLSGGDGSSETYRISVNKKDQTATIYLSESSVNLCILDGETVGWKNVNVEPETERVMYRFVGDTLVFSFWSEEYGKYERNGRMLVGGHSGDINGTWTIIPCTFYMDTERTFCDEEADPGYYQEFADKMVISSNSVTVSYVDDEYTRNRKYETSNYRMMFYQAMSSGGTDRFPVAKFLFESSREDDYGSQFPDVTSSGLSSNGETLSAGGKTVSVNVKKFNIGPNVEVMVEVNGSGKTCTSEFRSVQNVTKDLCNAENKDYLRFDDEEVDVNGDEIIYAYSYEYDNDDEFNQCIQALFP
jgi:hypothetical protein